MITPCMKYVKLYYRNGHYSGAQVFGNSEYYPVFICPKQEMRHADVTDIAQELIARTTSPEWRWQLRRPIAPGDVFTADKELYAFIDPNNIQPDMQPIRLDIWEHLAISKLGPELCTELTLTTLCSSQL